MWIIKFSKKESAELIKQLYYKENLPALSRKKEKSLKALKIIENEKRKDYKFVTT